MAVATFYVNADNSVALTTFGAGATHAARLSDADPTTGVKSDAGGFYYADVLGMTDPTTEAGAISNVRIYAKMWRADGAHSSYPNKAKIGHKVGAAAIIYATERSNLATSETEYYDDFANNGGVAWTWANIADLAPVIALQIGLSSDEKTSYATNCSEIHKIEVTYTPPSPPDAPTNVAASENNSTKVVVTWTKSTGATGYKVYRDGNLIDTVGDVATYDDTGAAAPVITPGTAAASDGTVAAHVVLSLSGHSIANGTQYTYKVRAINAAGDSGDSNTDTGYRLAGSLGYQWQRSAADSDADYFDIDGGITNPYNDIGAPADGSGRYFKCVLSATGSSNQTSSADRGYRLSDITVNLADYPFTAHGALSALPQVQLVVPALSAHAVLDAAPQLQLAPPPLSAIAVLDILDVLVTADTILEVPPFVARALLSAIPQLRLTVPPLYAIARLTAIPALQLAPGPFTAYAYLRAMRAATFADDDYYITYACVLSGMPDIVLPMASFHAEVRADAMSYLSVVIPGQEYTEAIASRLPVELTEEEEEPPAGGGFAVNYDPYAPGAGETYILSPKPPPPASYQDPNALGNLSVYMIKNYRDGNHGESLLMSVDLQEANYSRDAVSRGIILSGYKQRAFTAKTTRVYGAAHKTIIGGKYRYRCTPGFDVHPGDTIIMEDGNTFIAGLITWVVSPGQESMELAETDA